MTDTESVEKLKRAKASRKAHVAIITRKQSTFEQIVGKTTLELTDEDRNTAETFLASLSDKNKVVDSLNLEILDLTENTDEQMEAEIVHQDEIDMKLKSLIRKIESWLCQFYSTRESSWRLAVVSLLSSWEEYTSSPDRIANFRCLQGLGTILWHVQGHRWQSCITTCSAKAILLERSLTWRGQELTSTSSHNWR